MLMTDKQFLELFSSAHITSNRKEEFIADYKIINIEKYERKAQHFEFTFPKEGFLDFSILQFAKNSV